MHEDDEHDSQHPIFARLGIDEDSSPGDVWTALLERIEALEQTALRSRTSER